MEKSVATLSTYEKSRELVETGAYKQGVNLGLDKAIKKMPELEKYLTQKVSESMTKGEAFSQLKNIVG